MIRSDRLKFRVWDDAIGEYVKEYLYINQNGECIVIDEFKDDYECDGIIEMCTGLKDKNGTLIFQGDIVKPTDPEFKGLYEVKWNEKTYAFDFQKVNGFESQKFYYLHSDDVEIIGNIHDNA